MNGTVLSLLLTVTGAVVAFAIPDAPLTYAPLRALVEAVGAVVPAIERLANLSPIAEVAQVYWAAMSVVSLMWLPLFFKLSDEQVRPLAKAKQHPMLYRYSVLIAPGIFYYVLFLPFLGSASTIMVGSRFGLAAIGSLMLAALPLMLRACVTWYRYLPKLKV